MKNVKALTEKDLVLTLAGLHGSKKLSGLTSSYLAVNIEKALKDGRTKIDLVWYAQELLGLYADPLCKDKVSILDRLRELMFLGAVQDPVVIAKMLEATTPKPKAKMSDPFAQFRDKKSSDRKVG